MDSNSVDSTAPRIVLAGSVSSSRLTLQSLIRHGANVVGVLELQPDNPAATEARLALVAATAIVIRSGLAVMGVTPVEEMR